MGIFIEVLYENFHRSTTASQLHVSEVMVNHVLSRCSVLLSQVARVFAVLSVGVISLYGKCSDFLVGIVQSKVYNFHQTGVVVDHHDSSENT